MRFPDKEPQRCGHRDDHYPGCVCCEMDYAGVLAMQETGKRMSDYSRPEKRAGKPYADTVRWLRAEGISPEALRRMTCTEFQA